MYLKTTTGYSLSSTALLDWKWNRLHQLSDRGGGGGELRKTKNYSKLFFHFRPIFVAKYYQHRLWPKDSGIMKGSNLPASESYFHVFKTRSPLAVRDIEQSNLETSRPQNADWETSLFARQVERKALRERHMDRQGDRMGRKTGGWTVRLNVG